MPPDPFTTHADTIDAALSHVCRMRHLAPDDADEFRSWARLRLLEHDQAILRKFEGRSSIRTFLFTVVQRLFLDWRNAEWGKWRPTAEARRLGHVAVELERLVLRDRLTFEEAASTLVAGRVATLEECEQVWRQLPRRPRRQRASEDDLDTVASPSSASELVDDDESRTEAAALCNALARALSALPAQDQLLLQMRYWSGLSVAKIAVMTGHEQKGLYRRFERLAAELRRRLEAEGLRGESLHVLTGRFDLGGDDSDDEAESGGAPGGPPGGNPGPRPSTMTSTGGNHA